MSDRFMALSEWRGRRIALAPPEAAAAFSCCENFAAQRAYGRLPFGFHSWPALAWLLDKFGLQTAVGQ